MANEFAIHSEECDGERVVRVTGDVDLDTSPKLAEHLRKAIDGARRVVVDLHDVGYIDSSGVATLIQGLKAAGRASAQYALRNPSDRVMAVLDLAELPRLFHIERTEKPA